MYGLKQAPRAWNRKIESNTEGVAVQQMFKGVIGLQKRGKRRNTYYAVYVDDLFVTETNGSVIHKFKEEMSSKFEMSDLGKLSYYLGIEVLQHEGGITLNQNCYALRILEEAGMQNCDSCYIPMDMGLKLSKAIQAKEIDATSYKRNAGCLRYLLHTRPDLL